MSTEIPEGWLQTTLGEITTVKARIGWRGLSANEYTDDGPILIAGKHIKAGVIDWAACDHLSAFRYEESPEIQLQAGDVIISKDGSIGNPALIEELPGPASINGTMMMIRPHTNQIVPSYLYQVVGGAEFHRMIREKVSGSSIPHIFQRDIVHFPAVLPPLDEQRRIAEVLRSVDEAIAAAQDVAASMVRANETMRHELLSVATDGTIGELRTDWVVRPLEALASVERGKFSIRPRNDPRYFGGAMPFIQTGDITSSDGFIVRHTQTLNELGIGVSRVFPAGTIMTTIAANIGDFAIATYPVACPDSVVGIEAIKGVDAFWLYSVLTCFKVALDRASTQNAQKNINLQTLRPLQIPVPPRALMIELAETLSAAADGARQANAAIANLMVLKRSIQGDLLSGRVRVPG
jgi:type I restriction enzyme S subunit